ncbi:uncharacterized protein VTP21DRAFT_7337 [Calcarisporiella thermophila]|uniref:uncharacterized protein n=1 Tax=Calcarisporiella thermophila TaxID=911321 RepID=UPI0037438A44
MSNTKPTVDNAAPLKGTHRPHINAGDSIISIEEPKPEVLSKEKTVMHQDHENEHHEDDDFDWNEDDESMINNAHPTIPASSRSIFYSLLWPTFVILVTLGLVASSVVLGIKDANSHLRLWFTWLAFVFVMQGLTDVGIYLIPWAVRKLTLWFSPKKTERVMTRLEHYITLSFYIKLLIISSWAWGGFAVCQQLFNIPPSHYKFVPNRILQCVFYGALLLLVEKILLQIITTRFHQKAYESRIRDNEYALWVLDRFKKVIKRYEDSNLVDRLRRRTQGENSPRNSISDYPHIDTPMHEKSQFGKIERTYTEGSTFSPFNKRHNPFQNISLPDTNLFGLVAPPGIKSDEDETIYRAKKLARKLFEALIHDDVEHSDERRTKPAKLTGPRDVLLPEDFIPYFHTEEEARNAFSIFDKDGNGDISKKEMRSAVVNIYRDRKAIATALRDLSQCTGKLNVILLVVATSIWLLLVLSSFDIALSGLLPVWSALLALSFVFGQTAKEWFESVIFVFVTHPFDAGDRIFLNGTHMVVKHIGLLTTLFARWDGTMIYIPNFQLSTQNIENIRRSGHQSEVIKLQIALDTPSHKLYTLKDRLNEWIKTEGARDFTAGSGNVLFNDMFNMNKLELLISFEHKSNWQDMGARYGRRTRLLFALKEIIEGLDIKYYNVPQPVFPVLPPRSSEHSHEPSNINQPPEFHRQTTSSSTSSHTFTYHPSSSTAEHSQPISEGRTGRGQEGNEVMLAMWAAAAAAAAHQQEEGDEK